MATSNVHNMEHKFGFTPDQIVAAAKVQVSRAQGLAGGLVHQ